MKNFTPTFLNHIQMKKMLTTVAKIISIIILLLATDKLVAQPINKWAEDMGGTDSDAGSAIAVDANGNVYTTGSFKGTVDFDPSSGGTFNLTSAGSDDVFVTKFNASGNLVWAKQLGGTSSDQAFAICVDAAGNVYTTGYFQGTADFDPSTTSTSNLVTTASFESFVCKLDVNGDFVWAKQTTGTGIDMPFGIAVDASGNVYSSGRFESTVDFDPSTSSTFNVTGATNAAYVWKLDVSGNLVWITSLAGNGDAHAFGLALDGLGGVYVDGNFTSTGTYGAVSMTPNGRDIFVCKLNDVTGNITWAKQLGGSGSTDYGYGITADNTGVYITGTIDNTADFDPGVGVYNVPTAGTVDAFVCKLNLSGNFAWAGNIGGGSSDYGWSVALDGCGNVYSTGWFGSSTIDCNPGAGTSILNSKGGDDIYITKWNATTGAFVWAGDMGSNVNDAGRGIAGNSTSNIYITGYFGNVGDFDPNAGTYNLSTKGGNDIYVSHIGQPIPTITASGPLTFCSGDSVMLTSVITPVHEWRNNNSSVSNTTSIEAKTTGNYLVIVNGAGAGCFDTSSVTTVAVTPLPVAVVSKDTAVCNGNNVTLSASGGSNYYWTSGDSTNSINVTPTLTKTYTVTVSNGNCSTQDSVRVTVNQLPTADYTVTSDVCAPVFTNTSTGAVSYTWDFGDGTTSSERSPAHIYSNAGTYNTSLIATSAEGCVDNTKNQEITIADPLSTLFIPNAFTPNGDGINDDFKIANTGLIEFEVSIFNRWGEKIISWNDSKSAWDGTTHGKQVPEGTYICVVNAKSICDTTTYEKREMITVLR